ncbi:MAG: hypothetical protein ACTHJM_08335 [Marmoricola sp.]
MEKWRADLEGLVASVRAAQGDEVVRGALEELLGDLESAPLQPVPLAPPIAVMGVAACEAGWVGVVVRPDARTTLHVGATLPGLVEQVREQETLGVVGLADGAQPDAVAWVSTRPTVPVVDVAAGGGPAEERRVALGAAGLTIPAMYSRMGFTDVELLAACEAVVGAASHWP